mgnify:CR=1 FL=1
MKNGKVTLCITTGEIFISARHAATKCNIPYASLVSCCEGKQRAYHGMEFCYMEEAPLKIAKIAAVVRAKDTHLLKKELDTAKKQMEKAQNAVAAAQADFAAAQAKYNEIAAKMGQ